ncbi:TPA: hypothetical protein ACGO7Q_001836 [Streptococcus suis]
MSKKEANLTAIMLVQQLEDEYWLSSDYQEPLKQAGSVAKFSKKSILV